MLLGEINAPKLIAGIKLEPTYYYFVFVVVSKNSRVQREINLQLEKSSQ